MENMFPEDKLQIIVNKDADQTGNLEIALDLSTGVQTDDDWVWQKKGNDEHMPSESDYVTFAERVTARINDDLDGEILGAWDFSDSFATTTGFAAMTALSVSMMLY